MSRPSPSSGRRAGTWLLGGLLILIALAGCGAGATSTSSARRRAAVTVAPSSTTTATGASTASGTSTTSLPGADKPHVTIGDKNYNEQFVLGELYTLALQAQGYKVTLNRNIGPTDVTMQALKAGTLSMYPEYLNLFDTAIAGDTQSFSSRQAAYDAAQSWADTHGLQLLAPTPFSHTEGVGVTYAFAQEHHLKTLADLVRVGGSLTIGGPPQFESTAPGLQTIEEAYGFRAGGYKDLAVGDQYTALDEGEVQAADVDTTDGQLASGEYTLLADPDHVFGWGNVVPVVPVGVLAAEGPAFAETINRIDALLTLPVIRHLNELVDVAGQDPALVAQQFLITHGVIPPGPPASSS